MLSRIIKVRFTHTPCYITILLYSLELTKYFFFIPFHSYYIKVVYNTYHLNRKGYKSMKKIFAIVVMLTSFMVFAQAESDKYTITTTEGKKLHVTGTTDGLSIDEYKGKIVFLEFFGHKCPPCLMMIDRYVELKKKHKDKIAIVAIEVQGLSSDELKSFDKEKGINYITVSQEKSGNLVNYVSTRAQWQGGIPFLIIIDKKGNVQLLHTGPLSEDSLAKIVKELS